MAEVSNNLPCSPLGAPFHGEGTYLDYWPQQLAADPELESAKRLAKAVVAGSRFVKEPDNFYSPEYVEEWDRNLGPFNPMPHALPDLLYGATYILQVNARERVRGREVRAQTTEENVADAFLMMADQQGDMEKQRPTHSLLVAGEMVCKAAWSSDDMEVRDELMQTAGVIFARLHEDDGPATKMTIEAGQRLADIQLRELSQQIRLSCRIGEDVKPLQVAAARILEGQLSDLLRMPFIPDYLTPHGGLGGHMFEQLGLNEIRRAIYLDPNIQDDHLEVRVAYGGEDRPRQPEERKEDSAYDIVLLTANNRGDILGTEALQLKQGNGAIERERPYHPDIKVIIGRNITTAIMTDVAYTQRKMYRRGKYNKHTPSVDTVASIFEPYVAPAKAA